MEPKDFSPFLPHGITFGTYTDDEILGLSVKELTNPQSFDSLQHPTSGGLYDPALGPQDRDDQCETCGQMSQWCPGHIGHISLPLPVYNPVFFKNLFQILKGTCFSCNRLLARGAQCSLITHQLTALDHGLLHIVGEMQDLYSNVLNEQGTDISMEDTIQRQLEECLQSALRVNIENGNSYQVKHITEMKQQLIKQFLKDHLIPKGKICGHCKMPVKPMRSEHNTKIFFQKGLDRKSAREMIEKKNRQKQQRKQALQEGNSEYLEDEVVEMEDEKNEPSEDLNEKELSAISEQLYLTPMEARSHIRKVWSNDKAVFMKLFGALIMKNSHKYPTDIFFLDVVPVAPNRFRPMAVMKERKYEHPQSGNLSKVLLDAITIRQILADIQRSEKEGADITRSEEET
ncbi:DNA-directed RNA polymerase I subunit RPA1-like, partial [Lingula anatina]|uniref:DNA-directed RNA polymerase n=1 Tax=Lingula anatina TaxID=7574 RepID=A0A2R2MNF6_LINAN